MAASILASPLCTWLVASYTPRPNKKNHPVRSPMFQPPKRQNQGLTPKKLSPESCDRGETMAISVQPANKLTTEEKPPGQKRRVVVTGIGIVTALGHDPDIFYSNLLQGSSGVSEIENFDSSQLPTNIGGEIKYFSADSWVSSKLAKRADKFMLYLLTAGKKALADGGITNEVNRELNRSRCGIIIGSGLGGLRIFHEWIETMMTSSKMPNPFSLPLTANNMGSATLAMDLGWMGPNYVISAACATSNNCILSAAGHIIEGETDIMLCGGSDAGLHPIGLGGIASCRVLSRRNCDPTKASRPWDTDRDGIVVGDGAGVLLMEELEHAKQRGAKVYAEFLGGSFGADAYHLTQPDPNGNGMVLCLEKALADAGVAREDVNYINAHAASTQIGDLREFRALFRCFGNNPELRINSTKSMTGHLLGATGAVEAIAAIKAIQTGWIHPNINLDNPDKGVDINLLVGPTKERLDVKVALSNSFALGGLNSSILFAPYK
ncbi:3-oxoacyl-[acyl-carrier-protein] synthase II, chloroplastic-like [Herrania umbratica]|uniref:beta-ketoacyl-[acyl-carrier-protein] synthase I n=1 Tax=Herrania umbratica TaxID=108875 RepID=A0A6J1B5H3_9ROSI|nr:3-oxoacyl-[acyl-carrier-protein] synthase II, chloroplastic-like [Herrania umbratica]